jgi:HEPN domain-containing protein
MSIDDAKEWIILADTDLDSAKLLNESVRKHFEVICYHCAQAVEKYLKGYLVYNDIVPRKTHDLLFLNNICIEKDKRFESIIIECGFLNRFTNDIRYPHKYETNETDANFSIDSVEKIIKIEPIMELIKNVYNENKII